MQAIWLCICAEDGLHAAVFVELHWRGLAPAADRLVSFLIMKTQLSICEVLDTLVIHHDLSILAVAHTKGVIRGVGI